MTAAQRERLHLQLANLELGAAQLEAVLRTLREDERCAFAAQRAAMLGHIEKLRGLLGATEAVQ